VNNPLLLNTGGNIPFTTLQNYANARQPFWESDFDNNQSTIQTGQITVAGGVLPHDDVGMIVKGDTPNSQAPVFIAFEDVTNLIDANTVAITKDRPYLSTFNGGSVSQPIADVKYGGGKYATHLSREIVFADTYPYIQTQTLAGIRGADNGDLAMRANNLTMGGSQVRINTPGITVANSPNNIGAPQFYRPFLANVSDRAMVYPSQMPIRLWKLFTPTTVGTRVQLVDGNGNPYQGADWICCVVGFSNVGADRTYGCACFIDPSDLTWYVQYDQAGGTGLVTILAISSTMGINYGYDGSFP
jgi:hypothetical protein